MTKKTTKEDAPKRERKCVPIDGIAGIFMLFVAISVGYLIVLTWLLTRDWHYMIGGVPAALGAAVYLLIKAKN